MGAGCRTGIVLTPTIRTVAETGSTNADLLALAGGDVAEGTWLRAERQTDGRGRLGRTWLSPDGNLYASTIVRLRPGDPPAATLALVAAVSLQQVVEHLVPSDIIAVLKWPNDLLVDGAKISGILLERAGDAVVIGIGVNVASHPDLPDRPTTSLAAHGASIDAATVLVMLAESFARWVGRWRGHGVADIRARWERHAHPTGTPLAVRLPDGTTIEGLFDRLDVDGALILRLPDGERRVIHAADIFLI